MRSRSPLAPLNERAPAAAGFTLLESVMVIVLLAIIAAFVAPKAFNTSGMRLDALARGLASDLQRAQNLAATGGQTVLVCASTTIYLVQQGSSCPSPIPTSQTTQPVWVDLGNDASLSLTLPSPTLSYNNMGQPNGAATFQIVATGNAASSTVSVANLSGRVSIAKP